MAQGTIYKSTGNYGQEQPQAAPETKPARRAPGRLKKFIAGAALVGAAAFGIAKGAEAYTDNQNAENEKRNAAVEQAMQPEMSKVGAQIAKAYADQEKGVTETPGKKAGEVEFSAHRSDMYTDVDTSLYVVMNVDAQGVPQPSTTKFVDFKRVSGAHDSNPKVLRTTHVQMATSEGSDNVHTVNWDYKVPNAYGEFADTTGTVYDGTNSGRIDTVSDYHMPQDGGPANPVETARTVADSLSTYDDAVQAMLHQNQQQ
jgi:hypothetical protein